jgi:hypothetical protein
MVLRKANAENKTHNDYTFNLNENGKKKKHCLYHDNKFRMKRISFIMLKLFINKSFLYIIEC